MRRIKVAVMNTSFEITKLLCEIFSNEGYATCEAYTYLFKDKEERFDSFIAKNKPDVIVYDIAIPYKENYELFDRLQKRESVLKIPFILTTTNKEAIEEIIGKKKIYELIGKPYDLQQIVTAVRNATLA